MGDVCTEKIAECFLRSLLFFLFSRLCVVPVDWREKVDGTRTCIALAIKGTCVCSHELIRMVMAI